jgi:hypothetical protein
VVLVKVTENGSPVPKLEIHAKIQSEVRRHVPVILNKPCLSAVGRLGLDVLADTARLRCNSQKEVGKWMTAVTPVKVKRAPIGRRVLEMNDEARWKSKAALIVCADRTQLTVSKNS